MSIKRAIPTVNEYSRKTSDWLSVLNVWTFHVTIEKTPTEDEYQPSEFHVTIENQFIHMKVAYKEKDHDIIRLKIIFSKTFSKLTIEFEIQKGPRH